MADFDRPLTKRGRQQAAQLARSFAKRAPAPDLVASSPAPRAWQTAQVIAAAWDFPESAILKVPELYSEESVELPLKILFGTMRRGKSLLAVGHNPLLKDLAAVLLGSFSGPLRKGELLAIGFRARPALGSGRLMFRISPLIEDAAPG